MLSEHKRSKLEFVAEIKRLRKEKTQLQNRLQNVWKVNEYLRDIFERGPLGYQLLDGEGRILEVNDTWLKILGYAREDVLGRHFGDFLSSSRKNKLADKWLFLKEFGEILYAEFEMVNRLGSCVAVSLNARYTTRSKSGAERVHCILWDVTREKKVEESLFELEYYLHSCLDGLLPHIAMVDTDGTIRMVNKAWRRFALENGASPEDVSEGCNYFEVCYRAEGDHSDKALDFAEGMRKVMHGEAESFTLEYPCPSPENERWFLAVVAPLYGTTPRRVVISHEDITERKLMEEQLRRMSLYDSLTGLYNRNFFETEMERLADGRFLPVGIIVCDIDGLKLINDTLGHDKGDELLRTTARILGDCLRDSDIIARTGGDEFTVLLPECSDEFVRACCDRVRRGVENFNRQQPEFGFSISIGYAVQETAPVEMEKLFKRADDVMYRDKLQQDLSSRNATVQALIKTLQARDFITEGHARRLNEYAQRLGESMGLSAERLNDLQLLAQFHDLGKVGVPDRILFKPDRLTEDEFQVMKRHCEIGHRITRSLTDLGAIADYILKHHEHWDGSGYPLGLSGEDIPLESRILAIVDAFDTMTSDRPYKGAVSSEEALGELRRCAGTQFDPNLVEKAVEVLRNGAE